MAQKAKIVVRIEKRLELIESELELAREDIRASKGRHKTLLALREELRALLSDEAEISD